MTTETPIQSLLNTYHAFSNLFEVTLSINSEGGESNVTPQTISNFTFYVNTITIEGIQITYDFHEEHRLQEIKGLKNPQKLTLGIKETASFNFYNFLKSFYQNNYFSFGENRFIEGYKKKLLKITAKFFSAFTPTPTTKLEVSSEFLLGGIPTITGDYSNSNAIIYTVDFFAPKGYDVKWR